MRHRLEESKTGSADGGGDADRLCSLQKAASCLSKSVTVPGEQVKYDHARDSVVVQRWHELWTKQHIIVDRYAWNPYGIVKLRTR